MKGDISVSTSQLLSKLPELYKDGVTEFSVHDRSLAADKKFLFALVECVESKCPGLFISLPVDVSILDSQIVSALQRIYCSLEIRFAGKEKKEGDKAVLLFDKKLYANKAALLNNAGLVFGFDMEWGNQDGDTFKLFRDRLDFAISLYPNHIDFPQFAFNLMPSGTGIYSSKDLDFSCGMAFACRSFYTCGRAVPWFNSVIKPLKITPSSFFADFDEWQQCNNCSFITDFVPEDMPHIEMEKMQLAFLKEKYEEKHKSSLFSAVTDIVRLNGAFSRVVEEGEECVIETSYNPDDLLSPYASDIAKFCENACLEPCRVKIFAGEDSPDYKIL
ncbi:MAG: hypothetical protein K6G00_00375 [Treponema sp.]|nr:hypothetical protein [Treponema sp.]